jgi:hypothetical protein
MSGNDFERTPGVEAIMRVMDRQAKQRAEMEQRERRYRQEAERSDLARAAFLDHCQPASLLEYTAWMIGYLHGGGEPSHVYDRPFAQPAMQLNGSIGPEGSTLRASQAPPKWWVLAERPDTVPSLYGASSISVIVPSGLDFRPDDVPDTFHGGCGHSNFYFMDGFVNVGGDTPVYSDMLTVLAVQL